MRKWYALFAVFFTILVLLGVSQSVQAAEPPPAEDFLPEAVPAESIDPALIEAFEKDVNTGAKLTGEVLAFLIYTPFVDHVIYSADGSIALLWLGLRDPETGEVIATEPGLAIARLDASQKSVETGVAPWDITQQADHNWGDEFANLPPELLTEDLILRYSSPSDSVSKDAGPPYRGYKLPWAGGNSKRLSGSIGHFLIYNSCSETSCRYAYDFADGTMFPILAARGGTVFRTAMACPNGNEACNNYIVLKDESTTPTTYQLYLHMAYNSIPSRLRTIGATVVQGQYIGNADDTGASTGHHLHFHVHTSATSYWGNSVDVRFDDVSINDGRPRTCVEAQQFPNYGGSQCNTGNLFLSGNSGANPPTGSLIMPSHGQEITSSTFLVGGTAQDDLGIQKIQIIARGIGEEWRIISPDITPSGTSFLTEINMCTSGLPTGPVDIAARIYDLEGNQIPGGMAGLRTIVNNAPCGQVQLPACVPNADQVALYAGANYQGDCSIFGVGEFLGPANLGNLGDNNVESIMVGSNVRALLFDLQQSSGYYSGRSEAFEANDANLRDNRINANYTSALRVQTRTTRPSIPVISQIFNDFRRVDLYSNESYVVDFNSFGATTFRAELNGPVNRILPTTKENAWSIGSLPAGSYTLHVFASNSAGEEFATQTFTVLSGSLSNNTQVNAPVSFNFDSDAQNWAGVTMWYLSNRTLGNRTSNMWIFNNQYPGTTKTTENIGDSNIGGADLTSPPIYIPGSGYYLRFDYYYQSESFYPFWDQRWVQISVDDGPFTNLLQLTMDADNAWLSSQAINLSAYAGRTIRIRFHMDIVDPHYNNGFGWALDNITINTTAPVSCSDTEPNNTMAQASSLTLGNQVSGFICPGGDFDYYRLNLTQGNQIKLDVDAMTIGSSLDPYLFLYDSSGNLILENDDEVYASVRDSLMNYMPLTSGTYFAMVKAWDHPRAGSSNHFYTLKTVYSGDNTPPTVNFTFPSTAYIPSAAFTVQAAASDSGSGVQRVEFYWRSSDILNSEWILLGSDTNGSDGWTATFNPAQYSNVTNSFLVLKAIDNANNQKTTMRIIAGFDTTKPSSQLNAIPANNQSTLIQLTWSGSDPGGAILNYDLQSRSRTGSGSWSSWTDFLIGIPGTQTSAYFLGEFGKSYGFRIRARDTSNNVEDYPSDAEAVTTIASSCSGDSFESSDNTYSGASTLAAESSTPQQHNFCPVGDVDWVKVNLIAGKEYIYMISSRGGGAAMNVQLYNNARTLVLKEGSSPSFGQSVVFRYTPTQNQTAYLKITPLDSRLAGSGVQYSVWYGEGFTYVLPLIFR